MIPTPTSFAIELSKGVATITLDRPKRLNALTFEVYEELATAFESLDHHDDDQDQDRAEDPGPAEICCYATLHGVLLRTTWEMVIARLMAGLRNRPSARWGCRGWR